MVNLFQLVAPQHFGLKGFNGEIPHRLGDGLAPLLVHCAESGAVDYILGAEPGGGVFVVGRCEDSAQMEYLRYYKRGTGPFYLFYRPYHLCHFETPLAIARHTRGRPATSDQG